MNEMRRTFGDKFIMFIAGDGLALMRMNHVLAAKADQYIDMNPAIIPVQGMCVPHVCARAHARARC